jgi:hypothetical protein
MDLRAFGNSRNRLGGSRPEYHSERRLSILCRSQRREGSMVQSAAEYQPMLFQSQGIGLDGTRRGTLFDNPASHRYIAHLAGGRLEQPMRMRKLPQSAAIGFLH